MKTRALLIVLLLSPILPALAQHDVKPLAMLGTWRISAQHPSGTMITVTVRFTQNLRFTSSTLANDKPFMEASGTWKLDGKKLEWKYEQSSQPAIAPGFIDTDEVLNATETELTLKSKMSGKVQVWQRVQ